MSLFENFIGSKTNFCRTDKNNVLTGENTFNGIVNINGLINGLEITDIENLQTDLNTKATLIELQSEIENREIEDTQLNTQINDESILRLQGDLSLQSNIDDETQSRINSDNVIVGQVILKANTSTLNNAVTTLNTSISLKADDTSLANEIILRQDGDSNLQNNINTLQTNINTEIQDRQIADNLLQSNIDTENQARVSADTALESNLNFKLDKSRSIDSNLQFYCTQSQSLSSVISTITATGSVLSLGSGSFGNLQDSPLVINKQNMAIHAPSATSNICEILSPVTIPTTADRIRIRFVTFDGNVILNAKRSVYTNCSFTESVNIGEGADGFITMRNCEFISGKTITVSNTFGSALFFINCNFGGANLVLNQSQPTQVIINNCSGLLSFPTNATLALGNALTSGFIQNNIAKTILPTTGTGSAGQVLTSSGSVSLPDTWTTIESGGGGGGGESTCLELIHLYPKGQSVTSVRGDTISFQNVSERQLLTQSATDLTGSVISYRPPTGTTKVIYTFYTHLSNRAIVNSNNDANFRVFFGGTQVTIARQYVSLAQASATGYHEFSVVFNIGGTQNIGNAIIGSWDSLIQLKWDGARQNQAQDFHIHNILGFDEQTIFSQPKIKIEAYA